jgi:ABC-2 type transport system permease protein
MTDIRGLYTLWLREVKRYLRDRIRIVSSFVQPLLWLVIFGTGIRFSVEITGVSTPQYIFPGIVGQTLLFTSMFMGISVIWDREFGFLKEILVAPISGVSIFLGKMFGDSTDAVIQGVLIFLLGLLLGIRLTAAMFFEMLPIMLLTTFGLVSLGLTIASFIENLESFGAIQSFVNLPLFFISGALFPVNGKYAGSVPSWLRIVSNFNPLTYSVDALRTIVLSGLPWQPVYPFYFDILVICGFDISMIIIGTISFNRRK